jgi:hypothetical protein
MSCAFASYLKKHTKSKKFKCPTFETCKKRTCVPKKKRSRVVVAKKNPVKRKHSQKGKKVALKKTVQSSRKRQQDDEEEYRYITASERIALIEDQIKRNSRRT